MEKNKAMPWYAPLHSSFYVLIIVLFLLLHKAFNPCIQNTFTMASFTEAFFLPQPKDRKIFLP